MQFDIVFGELQKSQGGCHHAATSPHAAFDETTREACAHHVPHGLDDAENPLGIRERERLDALYYLTGSRVEIGKYRRRAHSAHDPGQKGTDHGLLVVWCVCPIRNASCGSV